MPILPMLGHEPGQRPFHIFEQQWLVLVDDHGGGRVFSLDIDEAILDARLLDQLIDLIGQVNELQALLGVKMNRIVEDLQRGGGSFSKSGLSKHSSSPPTKVGHGKGCF